MEASRVATAYEATIRTVAVSHEWGRNLQVEEALTAVEHCGTKEAMVAVLQQFIEARGFSAFAFLDAGLPDKDAPFTVGTADPQWDRDYRANNFIRVDPCLAEARRRNVPFLWSQLKLEDQPQGGRRSGAHKLMEAAQDHRFLDGMVIPYHFTDHLGRVFSSSTAFFWKDKKQALISIFVRHSIRYELHVVMLYWSQRMMDMVAKEEARSARFLDDEGQPLVRVSLTDRERDVLSWAARGKTVPETADILRISKDTVVTHMRSAMTKLGSQTKTHAVVKAIYLNLIQV